MSVWATVEDVQALYDQTVPTRTQAVLDRLERRLAELVPDLAARAELDPGAVGYLDADVVKDVVVDAAIRHLSNPQGFAYERDGDYAVGYSKAVRQSVAWFTDEELTRLRLAATSGPRTLGVLPPVGPPPCPPDPVVTEWTGDRLAGFRP